MLEYTDRPRARFPAATGMTIVVAAAIGLAPAMAAAQGGRSRVSYDVEYSVAGSLLDPNCTSTGTDVLTGTLVGLEPVPPHEPKVYVGTLRRVTSIGLCGSRTNPNGNEVVCSMNITGSGSADVMLTIEADGQGAWLKYLDERGRWEPLLPPRRPGPSQSSVTGTCDPAEMAGLQAEYDEGQTAGSPSGQPLEILRFPPSRYPETYAPRPPESIWTLKVIARRP